MVNSSSKEAAEAETMVNSSPAGVGVVAMVVEVDVSAVAAETVAISELTPQ